MNERLLSIAPRLYDRLPTVVMRVHSPDGSSFLLEITPLPPCYVL